MTHTKNVALVLSSGGARGYAHIGAIEALEAKGYRITSVAGASMGALIGGMYCAGKLPELKERLSQLGGKEIMHLLDFTVSRTHLVKGDKVIKMLNEIVPDEPIEQLAIPFRAIAADLETQREVVFSKGSLLRAIRASISIPTVFRPIKIAKHVLVDGGIANPLPLNRVPRTPGDLLISVNVSAPACEEYETEDDAAAKRNTKFFSVKHFSSSLTPKMPDSSYLSVIISTIAMLIQRNTVLAQKVTPPDVAINIPMNRFGVFDFASLDQIAQAGYDQTLAAIEAYEA